MLRSSSSIYSASSSVLSEGLASGFEAVMGCQTARASASEVNDRLSVGGKAGNVLMAGLMPVPTTEAGIEWRRSVRSMPSSSEADDGDKDKRSKMSVGSANGEGRMLFGLGATTEGKRVSTSYAPTLRHRAILQSG